MPRQRHPQDLAKAVARQSARFALGQQNLQRRASMNVGELANRIVTFAYRATPLTEAARLMREQHVGSLVVVDEGPKGRVPVGMLTDRDIVVAVVAGEVDPRTLTVGEVMQGEPITVREEDSVFDSLRLMRRRGIRRVPVVTLAGDLAGIITIDDLLGIVAEQLDDLVRAIATEQAREARVRK
jgi:CBS domain-containing protein